ncbi:MAG: hypothetical protein ABI702_00910 [Burkholderiales bacterium]
MSTVQEAVSNPFALMMDPEAVFAALARSERLPRLHSRICRPLDKPQAARSDAADAVTLDDVLDGIDDIDS